MIINPTRRREMKMKAQMKAIMASAVVIALCLAAVGGVTYSWFSDSEEAEIEVTAAEIDLKLTGVSGTATSAGMGSNTITNNTAQFPIGGKVTVSSSAFSSSSSAHDITIKNIAPGDTLDLTISGTLKNTISVWIEGSCKIKENGNPVPADCLLTATPISFKIDGTTVTNPVAANEGTRNITASTSISLAENAGNDYQNRTFDITLTVDVVQQNKEHPTYQAAAGEDGIFTIVKDSTKFKSTGEITGINSNDVIRIDVKEDTASVAISDYGFQIQGTDGTPLAALDLSLTNVTTSQSITDFGTSTITVTIPAPAGLDPANFTVKYVGGEGAQPESESISYNGTNNTISFNTTHFSKFVVMNTTISKVQNMTTGQLYTTLEAAINAVNLDESNGLNEIILYGDLSGNGVKVESGKTVSVNLNGYTYNIDGTTVGSSGTETNGFQLLKDSTVTFKNGVIASSKAKILIQNYSNLTLNNITLDGSKLVGLYPYTLSNNNGITNIIDSVIIAKKNSYAFDVYGGFSDYSGPKVIVSGNSVIDGKIEVAIDSKNGTQHYLSIKDGVCFDKVIINGATDHTKVYIYNNTTGSIIINTDNITRTDHSSYTLYKGTTPVE